MTTSPSRLTEMLRQVCLALQGQGISHALVGGMAVAAYGVLRATKDIDFLLDVQDRDKADVALSKLGFRAEVSTPGFARYVRHPVAGLPELTEWADLLFASHATGRMLIEQAQLAPLNPDGSEMVSLVSLEGLVLMKLLACVDDPARLQDRGDIIALGGTGKSDTSFP